jgi:hypothetical protein
MSAVRNYDKHVRHNSSLLELLDVKSSEYSYLLNKGYPLFFDEAQNLFELPNHCGYIGLKRICLRVKLTTAHTSFPVSVFTNFGKTRAVALSEHLSVKEINWDFPLMSVISSNGKLHFSATHKFPLTLCLMFSDVLLFFCLLCCSIELRGSVVG